MDIYEAIEQLSDAAYLGIRGYGPDFRDALIMGTGALQQIAQMRQLGISPIAELLPGETLSATGGDQ